MSSRTIEHLKQRFVEEGVEAALARKPQSKPRAVNFDGEFDARLTALACSKAPAGRERWTVRLLAEKTRGAENRRPRLDHDRAAVAKKNELQPHLSKSWKISPEGDAAFVAAMKDVLAVYQLPHDPLYPVVCRDESSKQLVGEVHAPIAAFISRRSESVSPARLVGTGARAALLRT